MIDFPVADTHLHLWDPDRLSYPWLAGAEAINRPHLLDAYDAATAGIPIRRMVFLQCECDPAQAQDECDWVEGLAQRDERIQGIVPWAPLERGEGARPALKKLAANPRVKGIRRILQFEPDADFGLAPGFVQGVQMLAEYGLSFDLCIKGDEQFEAVLALVRRCPRVTFMLDHIGKPFIKERILEPWAGYMRLLGALPNTWCKVSGLVNEAEWERWSAADLEPYLEVAFSAFNEDRVCFGGDWPVCTLASTYRRWFDTLVSYTAEWSEPRRRKLFHDNAITFYRLEE